MKKDTFLFIVSLILFVNTSGLTQKIKWGEEQKNYASGWVPYEYIFISEDEDGCYVQQRRGERILFTEKITWDLKVDRISEEVSVPDEYKGAMRERLFFFNLNQATYAMYKAKDVENEVYYYFIEEFDIQAGKFKFKKELFAINYGETPTGHFRLSFYFSPDETKMLSVYYAIQEDKSIMDYSLTAFEGDFDIEWEEKVSLPREDKYEFYSSSNFLFSNSGDIFIYGDFDNKKIQKYINKSKEKVFPFWDSQIIGVYDKGKTVKIYDIAEKKGMGINRTEMLLSDNGNLIFSGFYYDEEASEDRKIIGNYHLKINAETQEKEMEVFSPFNTEDFKVALNGLHENKDVSRNSSGNYSIVVGNVYSGEHVLTEDGTLYRTLRNHKRWVVRTDYGSGRVVKHEVSDIFLFKISPTGKISWIRKIPLEGRTLSTLHEVDNSVYVLFNDNAKNIDLAPGETPAKTLKTKKQKKGCLMLASFDSNGNTKRKVITTYEHEITGGVESIYEIENKANNLFLIATDKRQRKRYVGLLKLE